jgi:hypothetical protein
MATPDTQQAPAPNPSAATAQNAPPNTTRMYLSQAYTYNGQTYGPGQADVPNAAPDDKTGGAPKAMEQKEADYQLYLSQGGEPLPPVTAAIGDTPHYDPRLRRPGNVPPPRDVLVQQGRGADVPAPQEQRDAAAKEAADRDEKSGDKDRPHAGTAQDTAGQRQTARESIKGATK